MPTTQSPTASLCKLARGPRARPGRFAHWRGTLLIAFLSVLLQALGAIPFAQAGAAAPPSRAGQTQTQLPNGQYLVLGGTHPTARALLYDPATQKATPLAAGLAHPRRDHSATLLPDGRVLILGGNGRNGVVAAAEVFDPRTQRFEPHPETGLVARARHSALMTSDGQLMIVGGIDSRGNGVAHAERWDPRANTVSVIERQDGLARLEGKLTLQADGSVLVHGGVTPNGTTLKQALRFVPESDRFVPLDAAALRQSLSQNAQLKLSVAASVPPPDERHFDPDGLVILRFSKPVTVTSVGALGITLLGPEGAVKTRVVPSQDGMLAFVTPTQALFPGTRYTLFVKGVLTASGQLIQLESLSFVTRTLNSPQDRSANSSHLAPDEQGGAVPNGAGQHTLRSTLEDADDDEVFIPTAAQRGGRWRTGRALPEDILRERNALLAERGPLLYEHERKGRGRHRFARSARAHSVTDSAAVSGRVLRLNDRPLANASVQIGAARTLTRADGRFELQGVPAGRHELIVDGLRAGPAQKLYGRFVMGVDVEARGKTQLPPIYLPRIRNKDWISVPSPAPKDLVLTTPSVPGMEVHLPKGTVLRDRDGRIVTRVALVPVPLDRVAFAFPENAPVYVSVQPGGMVVQGLTPGKTRGIRVVYPNNTDAAPGKPMDFWRYDPKEKGWYVYGRGKVSADAKQVIPDPGVELYDSVGFMYTETNPAPPAKAPPRPKPKPEKQTCDKEKCVGDPVDVYSGLFLHNARYAVLRDALGLAIESTYRPGDTVSRAFGLGTSHDYAMYLREVLGTPARYDQHDLVLANGSTVRFYRTAGKDFYDQVGEPLKGPTGEWYKATLSAIPGQYLITKKDGTRYAFSFQGRLETITDRLDNTLHFTYTGGQLVRITSATGRFLDLTYDAANRITGIRDLDANTWRFSYTEAGHLRRATYPDDTFEEYAYDEVGQMLSVRDRRGNVVVQNEYDDNGRVRKQTLADGGEYLYSYVLDDQGKATEARITDPRGVVNRVAFHPSGMPASDTLAEGDALAQTTTYERQDDGLLTARIDARGRRTEFVYDERGNLITTTYLAGTPEALTERATYTSDFNQLASRTDALGRTTRYDYDAAGLLKEIKDPLNNSTRFEYTSTGLISRITDALGKSSELTYDQNDLIGITDALARTTSFYVDTLGRTQASTDALGNRTQVQFDALDRITQRIDAHGNPTQMHYDANGNLSAVSDARGGQTQFEYDAKNRRIARTDALGKTERYAYDGNDNLVRFTDRKGQVSAFTYDALNRRTQAGFGATTADPGAYTHTIAYRYDNANRLTAAIDSVSGTLARAYDERFDTLSEETSAHGSVRYTYDGAGRRASMRVAGQDPIGYDYDDADRLLKITQGAQRVQLAYDNANRRTQLTLPNGIVQTYAFDEAHQLTGITYTLGGLTLGDLTYGYDAAGRRIAQGGSFARIELPGNVSDTEFNAHHQLTQWNGADLSYDDNGNLLSDGVNTYTWNARDQLIKISGSVSASFQYDAFGRRQSKTINDTRTGFVYDGLNPVQEKQGDEIRANLLTGQAIDELYSRSERDTASVVLTDALGSTLALADSEGTLTTTYTYGPYGTKRASGADSAHAQLYTGREDDRTGLMYYRARHYHPGLARFISEDPIGLAGGINGYSYVGGNPISSRDPTGLVNASPWSEGESGSAGWVNPYGGTQDSSSSGGKAACVAKCLAKRQLYCIPGRAAGVLGGVTVAAAASAWSGGTVFPQIVGPFAMVGGNVGAGVCTVYFFEKSCSEECAEKDKCEAK